MVFEARAGPKDDPITTNVIDLGIAEVLFNFFFDKCHQYLPVVHFSRSNLPRFLEIRRRCSFLLTTILAIAARFYRPHRERFPSHHLPPLDAEAPHVMARLAYSHLAASLFRKQHQLLDVQATILLAGWGLHAGGRGPDPWLLTGHALRLAHRLGLHRVGNNPSVSFEGLDDEARDKLLTQWKTWLCWYHFDGFLSLGFGRPQTTQLDAVNEHAYLQALQSRPHSPELAHDVYIASLVQLTKIGRDLISWLQMLTDWHAEGLRGPLIRDGEDFSICSMLRVLNKRLDDWTNMWVWNGSFHALQLGPCSRLAKLQSEHVRLCLNSLALKPGLQENVTGDDAMLMQNCIKQATEAALNTIQTHFDVSNSDMILSYSVDYITITLGQAAVFLIRLHIARDQIPVDRAVLAHYLRMAIVLLEDTDLSETKISTYLSQVCRDLCRVGNVDIPPREGMLEE
ncbi:hypothetical protein TREMEDRAFT_24778 [Tremella mesenterica DSM 1558]|uniref:uncharacterized protein n=1 Tax=Tremella mesenterica (strain ATCC 24925 / CBS 8224 / DSM 1558 / NBRC 9311 / NRRL Y-6157 / RJB 2259-6 / UBC 559-6) TaxID=578456 RepID=UPI0003F4A4C1|nr:uncharacterized protein TREMEDRAFT_24778 [Tremella mesenterica DSM 1558]EIW72499.1 hypothetical protein TREMEDRAFT_24778 [Tremella mesenterica DSM 1558]